MGGEETEMKITVYKSKRLLIAKEGAEEVLRADIGLGKAPIGHKMAEGDNRTPEGLYYVCTKNEKSKFHLALGLSYPNPADARAALDEGRITPEQNEAVLAAHAAGKRPPWDTPLGGFIMIHGEHPEGREGDWTAGCIAMKNWQIGELFALSDYGDEVEILP